MAHLDFWFEYASTYSYPAAFRVARAAREAHVEVRWRPFLLGAIMRDQGLPLDSPFNWQPAKGQYMWRDVERICAGAGLRFERPQAFPQHSLLASRVAMVDEVNEHIEAYSKAGYQAEFAHGYNIGEPVVIGDIVAGLGLDPAEVIAEAQADAVKERLRRQTAEAAGLGIFGAPSFVTDDGELFWGGDRLDDALAWARAPGHIGGRKSAISSTTGE